MTDLHSALRELAEAIGERREHEVEGKLHGWVAAVDALDWVVGEIGELLLASDVAREPCDATGVLNEYREDDPAKDWDKVGRMWKRSTLCPGCPACQPVAEAREEAK